MPTSISFVRDAGSFTACRKQWERYVMARLHATTSWRTYSCTMRDSKGEMPFVQCSRSNRCLSVVDERISLYNSWNFQQTIYSILPYFPSVSVISPKSVDLRSDNYDQPATKWMDFYVAASHAFLRPFCHRHRSNRLDFWRRTARAFALVLF